MKKVTLTKVKFDELKALQAELELYADIQRLGFNFWSIEDFLNALLAVDIAHALWITLRNKIENRKNQYTMTFKISEAAILMKCCYWERKERGGYEKNVCEKYKNIIDQQLKNVPKIAE